jgi:hypothetical protein
MAVPVRPRNWARAAVRWVFAVRGSRGGWLVEVGGWVILRVDWVSMQVWSGGCRAYSWSLR